MRSNQAGSPAQARTGSEGADAPRHAHWRRWPGLKFGVIGFVACIIAVAWSIAITYYEYAVQRQIEYTWRTNDNLSAAFAAHTARALKEIEGLLRVISMEYRRSGRHFDLQSFAREAKLDPNLVSALVIVDHDGRVIEASVPNYNVKSLADREHFKAHVNNSSDQLYSARPIVGRFVKTQVIPFSLRISGPRGEFLGVVVAGVNPLHFVNLYQKVALGAKGAVSFFGLDGFIRARISEGDIGVGQDVRQAPIIELAREHQAGRLLFTAVTDGVNRYYSYQRVPGFPLAVAVGQAADEALAEMDHVARAALIGGVIVTLIMLAAAMLLVGAVAREQHVLRSLQLRSAELQSANKELETFAYSVAHDLRAPLRGIDGYSRLLLADYGDKLDDEGRRFLNKVRQAAQQMGELIEDLLAYSRLERSDLRGESIDPQELIATLLAERADEIEARGVNVKADLGAACVNASRDGLAMALRNLLENALKFSRNAPQPEIEIAGRADGGAYRFAVRDNGVGFDMKYHEQIFGIFQRLHRSEDYPGTGIGLAIVKKAAERMGGRVWAESAPGKGAVFYLELPQPG